MIKKKKMFEKLASGAVIFTLFVHQTLQHMAA